MGFFFTSFFFYLRKKGLLTFRCKNLQSRCRVVAAPHCLAASLVAAHGDTLGPIAKKTI